MRLFSYLVVTAIALVAPYGVHAAPQTFRTLVDIILDVINELVTLIIVAAVVVIIWGVSVAWILNSDDTASIEKGKSIAVWGVVIVVIMLSIWGIVALLKATFFA